MTETQFYKNLLAQIKFTYPTTAERISLHEKLSPNLVCPVLIPYPKRILEQADAIVKSFSKLRELKDRQSALETMDPAVTDPHHYSALMSYDFHLDAEGDLRLIEINTNASMALVADAVYRAHYPDELPTSHPKSGQNSAVTSYRGDDFRKVIFETFQSELELFRESQNLRSDLPSLATASQPIGGFSENSRVQNLSPIEPVKPTTQVVIIDENPTVQRLFVEFEMYRELFEQHGWRVEIADPSALSFHDNHLWLGQLKIDLVYNRDTDFYLALPRSSALRAARDAGVVCVTPSAYEYRLLADKERLEELSRPGAIENLQLSVSEKSTISKALIRTRAVSEFTDPQELWAQRKSLFFKPRRSFGGKAVYRGSSTSRGTFQQILEGDYLAQEFVPPSTVQIPVETTHEKSESSALKSETLFEEFKCDLRFYVYRDRIQLSCARLYQGQMTNSQTLGGGVAAIDWVL